MHFDRNSEIATLGEKRLSATIMYTLMFKIYDTFLKWSSGFYSAVCDQRDKESII